ncbi:unnamed protein product [Boreogadus saida]
MGPDSQEDFADIRANFSTTKWNRLCMAEKKRFTQIEEKALFMESLGLSLTPAFKRRKKPGQVRVCSPEETDSEEEELWTSGLTGAGVWEPPTVRQGSLQQPTEKSRSQFTDETGTIRAMLARRLRQGDRPRGGAERGSAVQEEVSLVIYQKPEVPKDDDYFSKRSISYRNIQSLNPLSLSQHISSAFPPDFAPSFPDDSCSTPSFLAPLTPLPPGKLPPSHSPTPSPVCDECRTFFLEECEVHGPILFMADRPVAVGEKDRAKKTLPAGFEIRDSGIPGAGLGVFYCGDGGLPIGTHFGPYEGHRTDEEGALESGYSWEIYKSRHSDYIDAKRETLSNWMRYVNCARNEEEQNVIAFQHKGGILYRTCGLVTSGAELLVWYGDEYARHLGIGFDRLWNNKSSTKGGKSQLTPAQAFPCPECPFSYTSQIFLHKHMKRSHGDLYGRLLRSGEIKNHQQLHKGVSTQTIV